MLKHFRGNTLIQTLIPSKGTLKRSLMGPFLLEVEGVFDSIYTGDYLDIEDQRFEIREITGRKVKSEHITYKLVNYALIDKYFNSPPTYDDTFEFTDITVSEVLTMLDPLVTDAGFTLYNNSSSTSKMDIDFSGDNLLSAIQKICDVFDVEFIVKGMAIYIQDQVGIEKDITLHGGINTKDIEKKINRSNICTRIYPVGSSENLPEAYYYEKLRPTTFDMTTETHSGSLNIDNTEGIDTYGVIEKIVDFPDVKVISRRGAVGFVGSEPLPEKIDKEYPFIYDADLSDIDEEKAKSSTLFFSNGLKAAEELRIVKASAAEKKIWYSKRLKSGMELDWEPEAGNTYVLVGYITQTEMNTARDKLITEAQKYLDDNSAPRVEYTVKSFYAGGLSEKLEIGDSLRLSDLKAGINTVVRVLEYTKNIITGEYTSLKFGNSLEKIPIEILQEQVRQKAEIKNVKQRLSGSEQTARQALERHNLLVNTGFYGDEKEEYALIGSKDRNYVLKGVDIVSDSPSPGSIQWTSGQFQQIGSDTPFTIGAGEVTLTVGMWYLYIQLKEDDPGNSSGNNKLLFSESALSDDIFKYFPLGMAEYVSGEPIKVATSYGFTLIDGNYIKTGSINADRIEVGTITSNYLETALVNQISTAASNSSTALENISDIQSDNKATPEEKQILKRQFEGIQAEYSKYLEQATAFGINTQTEFSSYKTKYDLLNAYITPILSSLTTTTTITGSELRTKFSDYYTARGTFLNRLGNEARVGADSAIEFGLDDTGSGRIIIRESISGDTALERYWRLGKDGMSYNVVDANGKYFSLNGGKIIQSGQVLFDPGSQVQVSQYPDKGVDLYIQENDSSKIGLSPNNVECMVSLAGISLYQNDTSDTETRTYAHPLIENDLVVGYRVGAFQVGASQNFSKSGTKVELFKTSYKTLNSYTFPAGITAIYTKLYYFCDWSASGWIENTFFASEEIRKIVISALDLNGEIKVKSTYYNSTDEVIGTRINIGDLDNPWVTLAIKSSSYMLYDPVYVKANLNVLVPYS